MLVYHMRIMYMILFNSNLIPCMSCIHFMHVMCIWLLLNFYYLNMIIINRVLIIIHVLLIEYYKGLSNLKAHALKGI